MMKKKAISGYIRCNNIYIKLAIVVWNGIGKFVLPPYLVIPHSSQEVQNEEKQKK